jgi:phospholipid-binding lipoprotein MlaA
MALALAALFVLAALAGCGHASKASGPALQPAGATDTEPAKSAMAKASPKNEDTAAREKAGAEQGEDAELLSDDLDFLEEESESAREDGSVADPLEPFNRAMFTFNDRLYFWVMKPVAQGYKAVLPGPARTGIRNVFANAGTPARFANCLLQFKGEAAGREFARFFINSTVGIGGLFDFAEQYTLVHGKDEDMGQTLGRWGLGNGFFVVWPFLGPSSLRDTVGKAGDSFLSPTAYMDPWWSLGLRVTDTVNDTSFRIGEYEGLKDMALDPYEGMRNAYLQNRGAKVKD